jgi:hypothetical protein
VKRLIRRSRLAFRRHGAEDRRVFVVAQHAAAGRAGDTLIIVTRFIYLERSGKLPRHFLLHRVAISASSASTAHSAAATTAAVRRKFGRWPRG